MLTKLALKNASKSLRDYAVYFFTLVLGVCVFYMFNSIYAQKSVMEVTETINQSMLILRRILSYLSVFVAIVLGFLIVYANQFFIRRRKKELGIYMCLGMSKRKISVILMLETSLMALMALVVGLVLGVFASQIMSVFTAKLFEANLSAYRFVFSLDAAIKSMIYFAIIFLIVILFNTIAIGRFKLIDLIYGGRKNEVLRIKSIRASTAVFAVSVACLVSAYVIYLKNGLIHANALFPLSIVLGTIGTLLFFLSLSGFLVQVMRHNKRIYYKDLNMFVVRQLSSKVNTNFVSISVVCLVVFLVIGIFSSGYSIQSIMSDQLRTAAPYDYSLIDFDDSEAPETILSRLPSEIADSPWIAHRHEYVTDTMKEGKTHYGDYDIEIPKSLPQYEKKLLSFISLSDYNALRQLQGMNKIELSEKNYLILCDKEVLVKVAEQFSDHKIQIKIGESTLSPAAAPQRYVLSDTDDGRISFVVSDSLMKDMRVRESVLNVQCKDAAAAKEFGTLLNKYQAKTKDARAYAYYTSKEELYMYSISSKVIISYLAIYLGIVFMITCVAILAIQQLSEAADNIERYGLLKKLGVEQKLLNHSLFLQILYYFLLPLLLAVIHAAVGLKGANEVIMYLGDIHAGASTLATAGFVVSIYGLYFLLTYMGSKSIVNKG